MKQHQCTQESGTDWSGIALKSHLVCTSPRGGFPTSSLCLQSCLTFGPQHLQTSRKEGGEWLLGRRILGKEGRRHSPQAVCSVPLHPHLQPWKASFTRVLIPKETCIPQRSPQHCLQQLGHGSNLDVLWQMNGYESCGTYTQWNITQLLKEMHLNQF